MEKAKDFLLSNSMTISNIAHLVGFDDPLYFSRVFKKYTGVSPQMYYLNTCNFNTPNGFSAILQTADSYLLSIFEYLPIERLLTSLPSRA